jgi:hypothetical protein
MTAEHAAVGTEEPEPVDLRAMARGDDPTVTPSKPAKLAKRQRQLHIVYDMPETGETKRCTVTISVLTRDQETRRGQWAAAVAAVPWFHLPPSDQQDIWALATALAAIDEKTAPDWVLEQIADDELLRELIYQEVEAHRAEYFPADVGTGQPGETRPRVSVTPADASGHPA